MLKVGFAIDGSQDSGLRLPPEKRSKRRDLTYLPLFRDTPGSLDPHLASPFQGEESHRECFEIFPQKDVRIPGTPKGPGTPGPGVRGLDFGRIEPGLFCIAFS